MLYGKHLGYRGRVERALESGEAKLLKLVEQMERVKAECREGLMHVRCVWRWLEGDLFHPALAPLRAWFDRELPAERRIVPDAMAKP